MVVNVDLGERVKIKTINFEGNEVFKNKKLRSKLKKTKESYFLDFGKVKIYRGGFCRGKTKPA